jgi:phospholipid-translocating ATPase
MRELKLEDTPDDLENDEKFEKEYDLLGVTGVEDLLQDNVR